MESSGPALGSTMRAPVRGTALLRGLVPATVAAVAFALLTLGVTAASGAGIEFLVLDAAIGFVYIGSGVIAWLRRPEVLTGPLLVACGVFNFVGSYGPSGQPVVTHIGFAFEQYYDVALAVLVLALPARWPTGAGRALSLALLGAFFVRSVSRLLLQDPSMFGCPDCVPNPFVIASEPAAFVAIETTSNVAIAVIAVAIAGECLRRLVASRPIVRHVMWPILAAGVVAMAVAAFDAAEYAVSTATGSPLITFEEPWSSVVSWMLYAARLLVPIGLLVGSLRLRRAGGPLVPLAVGLERVPSPARLQAALAAALGDPDVRLLRPAPDGGGWTAADGRPAAAPVEDADHAVTMLEHEGRPLAAIVHDPVLREDPTLVRSVLAVLRLAVENERLDGALQTQLEEVRASRARLVVAAEDERRRIERDLHDGAQQRLVAVTIALQQARQAARDGASPPELEERMAVAADELKDAIADLRELARGIHPALLEDDGLPAAVAALGRRASVPVETTVELDRRLPRHIEATAYFLVAEALTNAARHAGGSKVDVTIRDAGGRLVVVVEDDGAGGADPSRGSGLAGLADRVASVDGRLTIESLAGRGTTIRAELPIA
jgi:signal transduction histidine kinase